MNEKDQIMLKLYTKVDAALTSLRNDRKGVSTIEYAALSFAVIAIIGGVFAGLGGAFDTVFGNLATAVEGVGTPIVR